MKRNLCTWVFWTGIMLVGGCTAGSSDDLSTTDLLDDASIKLEQSLEMLNDTSRNPRTVEDGALKLVASRDWTSGFFPGMLWLMYEYTGDKSWMESAHHGMDCKK